MNVPKQFHWSEQDTGQANKCLIAPQKRFANQVIIVVSGAVDCVESSLKRALKQEPPTDKLYSLIIIVIHTFVAAYPNLEIIT